MYCPYIYCPCARCWICCSPVPGATVFLHEREDLARPLRKIHPCWTSLRHRLHRGERELHPDHCLRLSLYSVDCVDCAITPSSPGGLCVGADRPLGPDGLHGNGSLCCIHRLCQVLIYISTTTLIYSPPTPSIGLITISLLILIFCILHILILILCRLPILIP